MGKTGAFIVNSKMPSENARKKGTALPDCSLPTICLKPPLVPREPLPVTNTGVDNSKRQAASRLLSGCSCLKEYSSASHCWRSFLLRIVPAMGDLIQNLTE